MTSKTHNRHLLFAAVTTGALASSGLAYAAENAPAVPDADSNTGQLEEVTVTAQKQRQSLQEVPLSIAAVSSQELDRRAINGLGDMTVPGVNVSYNVRATVAIRGISSGFNSSFDQSVPLFLDNVYFGKSVMSQIGLFDLERVEVLRGPQAIFFGKNAVAGAFSVVARRPDDQFAADVSAATDFEAQEQIYRGGVTLPATDTLSFRLAGSYDKMEGWLDNTFLGGHDPQKLEKDGRIGMLWKPTADFSLYTKYDYFKRDLFGSPSENYNCGVLAPLVPGFINLAHDDCKLDGKISSAYSPQLVNNIPDRADGRSSADILKVQGGVSEASYNFLDGYNFTGTVGHYTAHSFGQSKSGTEYTWSTSAPQENYRLTSVEARVSSPTTDRLSWITGVYYDDEQDDLFYPATNYPCGDPRLGTCATALAGRNLLLDSRTEGHSWSAYAQASYKILDPLTLVVAGRYSSVTKSVPHQGLFTAPILYDPITGTATPTGPLAPTFTFDGQHRVDTRFQPAVTLEYRPWSGAMFFTSYKEGFKAGGFDVEAFSLNPFGNTAFEPEYVKDYEAGMRLDFFDDRARLNFTVFRSDFTNLQVSSFNTVAGLGFFTQNAAAERSQGAEVEGKLQVTRSLAVGFDASYLDAKYRDFPGASCYAGQTVAQGCIGGRQSLAGHATVYSPRWSGNVNSTYTHSIGEFRGETLEFVGFANVYLSDRYIVDVRDGPYSAQPGYGKIDATLGLQTSRWNLSFIGRNLNDRRVYDTRQEASSSGFRLFSAQLRRTRELMLQLRFQY
jgi:outer membrane receptor protein involved in Fe transport